MRTVLGGFAHEGDGGVAIGEGIAAGAHLDAGGDETGRGHEEFLAQACKKGIEFAPSVKGVEIVAAAEMALADEDLRHRRAAARLLHHLRRGLPGCARRRFR